MRQFGKYPSFPHDPGNSKQSLVKFLPLLKILN